MDPPFDEADVIEILKAAQSLYLVQRPAWEATVESYYSASSVFEDPLVYAAGQQDIAANFRAIGWLAHASSVQTWDWFFSAEGGAKDEPTCRREMRIASARKTSGLSGTLRIDHTVTFYTLLGLLPVPLRMLTILYVVNGQIVKHKDLWSVADLAAPFSLVAALYMLARQVIGAAVGLIAWVLSMSSPATPPYYKHGDHAYERLGRRNQDYGSSGSTGAASGSSTASPRSPRFVLQMERDSRKRSRSVKARRTKATAPSNISGPGDPTPAEAQPSVPTQSRRAVLSRRQPATRRSKE